MSGHINHQRRQLLLGAAALSAGVLPNVATAAAEPLKVGLIVPMSGPFASTGRQIEAAVKLFMRQNGASVAGRQIEIILKDDGGVAPDVTKRLAQELVSRDKVQVLAGFGLTPLAFAAAPVATQARVPMIVMAAAASAVPQRSPYIVRTGFTLAQVTAPMAQWAVKNKIKSAVTLVSDYGPGLDAEKVFVKGLLEGGGKVVDSLRAPLRNPDYAPFLARVRDLKPDALFVFVPSGEGAAVLKQFTERGLAAAGIRLICTGDVLDDDLMASIGPAAAGVVSSHHYSAAHPSAENKAYVEAFGKANPGMRPNFHSVGAYDGMHLLYQALKQTHGDSDSDKLLAAMKGMAWTSVRGPVSIDAASRDIVQTVYIRKAEASAGSFYNIEFDQADKVRDPGV
ncbi:ABC transporter substrate-binding protein [Duganella violaceipulchra]|uniref:ABC transporter substrate-binding protein n=1 Tax=Duganella violaceipulchra TaxID=2849652 RepID=A0AA41H2Z3_9BURK|nr:ABC transporter substrate-binding protein [Duganella violaceicalia]MBV6319428.1 ABC transporter substrate-binding protein [Duganella violaceicalia]MCP2006761.1 branched-chain amino acid transport system substrate-binding protein [Duganella violaceicalia]